MTISQRAINPTTIDIIKRFKALKGISHKYHRQLLARTYITHFDKSKTICKAGEPASKLHFLLKGSVEVRISFDDRKIIDASDINNNLALENMLNKQGKIITLADCTLLSIDIEELEKLTTESQHYHVYHLEDGDLPVNDADLIDDNFQEDWDANFIQSPLAASLSTTAIHQLMSQMEDCSVNAGETIIQAGSNADYFYILKQGKAVVHTDQQGPFGGEKIILFPGNYFGDEALVGKTTRNASIVMESVGLIGRVNQEAFSELIQKYLVRPKPEHINLSSTTEVLDVRLLLEYKKQPQQGAVNIPVSLLRKQLDSMKKSIVYLIAPTGDGRSHLATYIMRQAGFNAYELC